MQSPVYLILALLCFALVLLLNYIKARVWAGRMTAEALGYMLGGVLVAAAIGAVVTYFIAKCRTKKTHSDVKFLCTMAIALLVSMLSLAGELVRHLPLQKSMDVKHEMGSLLKEAAGKQPGGKDAHWWDGPARDFFSDILQMNQKYSAEVSALDNSAIKDLYSARSYATKEHMQKVVTQLQAALALDQKYASLDPIIQKLEDRVAAANVSEAQKQEYLKGLKSSTDRSLAPRRELIRIETDWMNTTISLYEFLIEHKSEYSVKDKKLVFRNGETKDEFLSRQKKAIELHHDYLKTKSAMEETRKKKLDQMGISPTDLSPAQLGKPQ